MTATPTGERFLVLDDDPTGVQALAGVTVLFDWDLASIRDATAGRRAVHLITNTRAFGPERVEQIVASAARSARDARPDACIVLRGDSTLRGHLREEYLGVRKVVAPGSWPLHVIVPALPAAGRLTIDGVHILERDGVRMPLSETEYARDGVFSYHSARLLEWAEERSGGLFPASSGGELDRRTLRSGGAPLVRDRLLELASTGRPAVFAPDAATDGDLMLIAAGYRQARAAGASLILRCAPALVGRLAGTTARGTAAIPSAGQGILVVCGSYVPQSTRQLASLLRSYSSALVEADVSALAGATADSETARLAAAVDELLERRGLAVLATPRKRPPGTIALDVGERIAHGIAQTVARLAHRPALILAKGGITSAITLREGVGASEAEVVGPVEPGVSRWLVSWPDGAPLDYLVVPGNVGDDELLTRLVTAIRKGSG